MNSVLETTWLLKNTVENSEIVASLESDFDVQIDPPTTSDMTIYDDFDAHLWNANHILCRIDNRIFQLIGGSRDIAEVRASAKARFHWDFPDGDIRGRLKKLIGLRAVMPLASMSLVSINFLLRNSDEKIVAKGQFLQSVVGESNRHYVTLQEMRGYRKSFLQARKRLKPAFEQEVPGFGMRSMLIEQKLMTDGRYTSQPLHLSADMPAELAVRSMAIEMIEQATRHVDGVVADTDTVFLHQFRVSVRKLRSLISLLKESLPPSTVDFLAPRLSDIAGKTSRLRDLDVFLLDRDSYRAMLPDTHEDGLNALYALVEKQRQRENTRLARYFSSTEYQQNIANCKSELSTAPAFCTSMSQKAVLSVAKVLLIKRYRKIRTLSARLNARSVDDDVHDIRKEFKKFRYLIEFFIELLPGKRTARLISRLKKLQLTLGQFNDYCVQIEFLNGFSDDRQIEMTKALSGLVAVLHHKRLETRSQVEAALARFFTEDMSMEMELAFGAKASGESQ